VCIMHILLQYSHVKIESSENVRETKLTRQVLFTKAVCCKEADNIATVC
jgi:hypothetical protein